MARVPAEEGEPFARRGGSGGRARACDFASSTHWTVECEHDARMRHPGLQAGDGQQLYTAVLQQHGFRLYALPQRSSGCPDSCEEALGLWTAAAASMAASLSLSRSAAFGTVRPFAAAPKRQVRQCMWSARAPWWIGRRQGGSMLGPGGSLLVPLRPPRRHQRRECSLDDRRKAGSGGGGSGGSGAAGRERQAGLLDLDASQPGPLNPRNPSHAALQAAAARGALQVQSAVIVSCGLLTALVRIPVRMVPEQHSCWRAVADGSPRPAALCYACRAPARSGSTRRPTRMASPCACPCTSGWATPSRCVHG